MSQPISPATLLAQLRWRYATKKFDATKKLTAEQWAVLEEALVLSPSSFGLQPYRFYVVTTQELKDQLPPATWGQTQVKDASHVVVFAVKKSLTVADVDHFIARIAEVRGVTVESIAGYRGMIAGFVQSPPPGFSPHDWAAKQAYIALGQLMDAAALLGIDTCPMEGFEPAKYDEILGIAKDGYASVVVAPVGFRAADDKYATLAKVRLPAAELVKKL